ncbi:MAG: DUF1926 domain-containing protein [Candidatus Omnitrophica bacterium]|nr:DUF1926 domain-containing protein [Candidatus Omnitrophota bacterium]
MTPSVTLLMAIHCHQPVGNFGFVFEEADAKAYDPFLKTLERHPGIRLALHYSGPLLDWLLAQRDGFVQRLRALVNRGQVELLASGYYEPILPLIPEADRQGQIAMMRAALRRQFRTEAHGLWLTERVWEPDLAATLERAKIRYTMVDTNQFASAKPWLPGTLQVQDESFWDLLGCYTTDYAGSSVLVFPASKRLRYWMPFQRVEQTIEFLKRLQRDHPVAITFADDGEKFGLWPKTYQWVYAEGWLDQFFTAIERERSWLATTTVRDYATTVGPSGRVSLGCGSYEEMLEWSGGSFRNFFTKYAEANAMQQKMLRISRTIADLKRKPVKGQGSRVKETATRPSPFTLHPSPKQREALLREAERELYAGQCNCAYWHGVFGGLYLSHLRRAVYAHLIAAERDVDRIRGIGNAVTALDADADGCPEVCVKTSTMEVLVDPAEGGAVTEWCLSGPRINLLDTLSRSPESYHEKLRTRPLTRSVSGAGAPASIHDVLGVKESDLASSLVYDDHRRSAFLDYAFQAIPSLKDVVRSTWGERRLWAGGSFRWQPTSTNRSAGAARTRQAIQVSLVRDVNGGRIRKTIRVAVDRPVLDCHYALERVDVPVAGLEFNLSLRDERHLASAAQQLHATAFHIEEPAIGVSLRLAIDPPATLIQFPIETVSESEEGLERTYQGLCVVCFWSLEGAGRRSWSSHLRWTVEARA